jgi:hypothetical protein
MISVTDRTEADVEYALLVANQDLVTDLKGAFNVSDYTRIKSNIEYLHGVLVAQGIVVSIKPMSALLESEYPLQLSIIDILRDNTTTLADAYYYANNPPVVYGNILDYVQVNNLEMNLYLIDLMLNNMIEEFKYSGELISGEVIL